MKNLILAAFVAALSFSPCFSQKQIKQDSKGNFYETRDSSKAVPVLTGKTFTDSRGQVHKVWKSAKGKYFVNITSKKGNTYKKYLN